MSEIVGCFIHPIIREDPNFKKNMDHLNINTTQIGVFVQYILPLETIENKYMYIFQIFRNHPIYIYNLQKFY